MDSNRAGRHTQRLLVLDLRRATAPVRGPQSVPALPSLKPAHNVRYGLTSRYLVHLSTTGRAVPSTSLGPAWNHNGAKSNPASRVQVALFPQLDNFWSPANPGRDRSRPCAVPSRRLFSACVLIIIIGTYPRPQHHIAAVDIGTLPWYGVGNPNLTDKCGQLEKFGSGEHLPEQCGALPCTPQNSAAQLFPSAGHLAVDGPTAYQYGILRTIRWICQVISIVLFFTFLSFFFFSHFFRCTVAFCSGFAPYRCPNINFFFFTTALCRTAFHP